jgi:hypothetical protein
MESSEMQTQIINLGKSLVKELRLEQGVDTPARWMAHYIAEQMTIAENETGHKKVKAEQLCFDTILKLWQHRSSFPDGRRPFENFEPVFRALERLDPENKKTYYYDNSRTVKSKTTNKAKENVQQWLDAAEGIDQVVRIWLDYVFKQAALDATDENTIDWIKNSSGLQEKDEVSIIIRMRQENLLDSDEKIQKERIELIKGRIEKLEAFNSFNQSIMSIFKKELDDVSEDDSPIEGGDSIKE